MSTRYVWKHYEVEAKEGSSRSISGYNMSLSLSSSDEVNINRYLIVSHSYRFAMGSDGKPRYYPVGTTANNNWKYLTLRFANAPNGELAGDENWPYAIYTGPESNQYGNILFRSGNGGIEWYLTRIGADRTKAKLSLNTIIGADYTVESDGSVVITEGIVNFYQKNSEDATISKTYLGNKSSQSREAYPDDGMYSYDYYVYEGSDNIDPISISYSKEELESGESVKVSVSPRSNTYGGTIYYQYSYSSNGGESWVNIGETTETVKTITVPDGIEQFQIRVRASDNMGFTSDDYVAGANLPVFQLNGYVGINGKARKVDKLYVGVNGKARQVVKGYIGVNGKARKFL